MIFGVASMPIAIISSITSSDPGSGKTLRMNGTMKLVQSVRSASRRAGSIGAVRGSSSMYDATDAIRSTRSGWSLARISVAFRPRDAVTTAGCRSPLASITANASAA
jgi:hypothetical protein